MSQCGECPSDAPLQCERCEAHKVEQRILKWCRNIHRGDMGPRFASQPVMRKLNDGTLAVLDMGQSEPLPGGYEWQTRDKRHAQGKTWKECLEQLQVKGAIL